MIYIVKINDTEYEVEVEKGQANITKTTRIETAAPTPAPAAEPAAPAPAPVSAAPSHRAAAGSRIVKAPMPGTILDIKVQPGARVKQGATLLILEAMKMENEVVAPADGVVAQIFVVKGASVSTNDDLLSVQ